MGRQENLYRILLIDPHINNPIPVPSFLESKSRPFCATEAVSAEQETRVIKL